jgi:hypothetical protein
LTAELEGKRAAAKQNDVLEQSLEREQQANADATGRLEKTTKQLGTYREGRAKWKASARSFERKLQLAERKLQDTTREVSRLNDLQQTTEGDLKQLTNEHAVLKANVVETEQKLNASTAETARKLGQREKESLELRAKLAKKKGKVKSMEKYGNPYDHHLVHQFGSQARHQYDHHGYDQQGQRHDHQSGRHQPAPGRHQPAPEVQPPPPPVVGVHSKEAIRELLRSLGFGNATTTLSLSLYFSSSRALKQPHTHQQRIKSRPWSRRGC